MMSSLGSDFFAGGALGVASSAIAVLRAARRGIPGPPVSEGGFVRAKRHLSAVAAKGLRAAFQTSSDQRLHAQRACVVGKTGELAALTH